MKKKVISIMLAAVLGAGMLTACGSSATDTDTDTSADAEVTEVPQEAYDDIISYLTDGAIKSEDVLYTVNGQDIKAQEFFYWLTYEQYLYQYNYYSAYYVYPDFSQEYDDGTTMADYVLQDAYYYATVNAAGYALALADGVVLSETNQEYCDTYLSDCATSLGESLWEEALAYGTVTSDYTEEEQAAWIEEKGNAEMVIYLMSYATNVDGLQQIYVENYYLTQYKHDLYDEGGVYEISDEYIEEYIEDNGILNCRYIMFASEDYDDDEANAEAEAELKAEAEACLAALSGLSGDELDDAIAEYTANNSDGNTTGELVFYASDTIVDGFREVVEALEIGELGMTELTDYGYFVVIRDEVTEDTIVLSSSSTTLLDEIISNEYQDLMDTWVDEMEVVDHGLMDSFDVLDFFDRLDALRTILDEVTYY